MADIKWIKVAVDMFEDSKIEFIRSLPEGDSIIVTWIQMLSIAGKSNMGGYLLIAEGLPYTEQYLCDKLRRSPTFMTFALDTLIKLKMVNIEDGPFHITNWEKHQNLDGMEKVRAQNRERKRVQREREKQILLPESGTKSRKSHVTVTDEVTPSHAIDIDKEIDIKNIYGDHIELTDKEHQKLLKDLGSDELQYWIDTINDWFTQDTKRLKKYSDHNRMIRTWKRNSDKKSSSTSTVGRTGQAAYTRGIVKPDNPIRTAEEDAWFDRYAPKGKMTDA